MSKKDKKELRGKKRIRTVQDLETGEIFESASVFSREEDIQYSHVHKNSRKALSDYFKKLEYLGNKTDKDENFIANMHEGIKRVTPDLSVKDAADFVRLTAHLTMYSDGFLVNKRGERMGYQEISEVLKLAERQTKAKIKKYKKLNMLDIVPLEEDRRIKHFRLSKDVNSMGEKGIVLFTKLYVESLKELLENEELGNALGTFYFMLPYVHFQTYYLVKNPNHNLCLDKEKSFFDNLLLPEVRDALEHICIDELATIIGINLKTLLIHLNQLEDLNVIKMSTQGDSTLIVIHPKFVGKHSFKNDEQKYMEKIVDYQFSQHDTNRKKRGVKDKKEQTASDLRKERIKELIKQNPEITNKEVAQIMNLHRNTISKIRKEINEETVR